MSIAVGAGVLVIKCALGWKVFYLSTKASVGDKKQHGACRHTAADQRWLSGKTGTNVFQSSRSLGVSPAGCFIKLLGSTKKKSQQEKVSKLSPSTTQKWWE